MRLFPPIQALMGLYAGLATARVSLARVDQIFETRAGSGGARRRRRWLTCAATSEFENVTLSFDRSGPVLDVVSFTVAPGETLAIVGPSGSGKSTIADLLLRLLDPDDGTVRLDGRDLREVRLADLRRHVVLVDQEPFVFHASDRGEPAVRAAGRDQTGSRGCRAGGRDRRIHPRPAAGVRDRGRRAGDGALGGRAAADRDRARVPRRIRAVLVLDEPTAALDPISERQVVAGYEAIMRGRTTILISHRLELAIQADRVVVLDGARIVESGDARRTARPRAHFARLFATAAALP